jgi:hypothetical protein
VSTEAGVAGGALPVAPKVSRLEYEFIHNLTLPGSLPTHAVSISAYTSTPAHFAPMRLSPTCRDPFHQICPYAHNCTTERAILTAVE